jgi:hypothetical protein
MGRLLASPGNIRLGLRCLPALRLLYPRVSDEEKKFYNIDTHCCCLKTFFVIADAMAKNDKHFQPSLLFAKGLTLGTIR